jgi:hypothetical protein
VARAEVRLELQEPYSELGGQGELDLESGPELAPPVWSRVRARVLIYRRTFWVLSRPETSKPRRPWFLGRSRDSADPRTAEHAQSVCQRWFRTRVCPPLAVSMAIAAPRPGWSASRGQFSEAAPGQDVWWWKPRALGTLFQAT